MPPLPFVQTVVHLAEVDSTSSHARQLAAGNAEPPLPFLVRADRQTQGRGRGGNVWWSDAGSLTFTVVFAPAALGIERDEEPLIALAAGAALVWAIEPRWLEAGIARIKWPNDLELAGKKAAGILAESFSTGDALARRVALGIGVNISTRFDRAPHEIQQRATSIAAHARSGQLVEADAVLAASLDALSEALAALRTRSQRLFETWKAHDALLGRPLRVELGTTVYEGVGAGIDAQGRLLVASERGVVPVIAGTVRVAEA